MRQLAFVLALLTLFGSLCAQPAFARPSAGSLLQPLVAELDIRLAALAAATTPSDLKLKAKIAAARVVLANSADVSDEEALALLKKFAAKLAKALPADPAFDTLLGDALGGFTPIARTIRDALGARIDRVADPLLAAKARKGLAKLDGLLADAAAPGAAVKVRAKALGSALVRAALVNDLLSRCPGHPGEFGHGKVLALADGEGFSPRFASGELFRDPSGTPHSINIDGYHFPHEKGSIGLTVLPAGGTPSIGVEYSYDQGTLAGSYQKDGTYHFIESGTLTLTEFDPVARRIVGEFEFTGHDLGSDTRVVITSGSFAVCDFKVTTIAKR